MGVPGLNNVPRSTPGYRVVWCHLASARNKIMENNLVRRSKRAYCRKPW